MSQPWGILVLPGVDGRPIEVKVDLEALYAKRYTLKVLDAQKMKGGVAKLHPETSFMLNLADAGGAGIDLDELLATCEETLDGQVRYQLIRFGEIGEELVEKLFREFGVIRFLNILRQGDQHRIRKELIARINALATYLGERIAPDLNQTALQHERYEQVIEDATTETTLFSQFKAEWQGAVGRLVDAVASIDRLERDVLAPVIDSANAFFKAAEAIDPTAPACRQVITTLTQINNNLGLYWFEIEAAAGGLVDPDDETRQAIERVNQLAIEYDTASQSLAKTWQAIQASYQATVVPVLATLTTARDNLLNATETIQSLRRDQPALTEAFRESVPPTLLERAEAILTDDAWGAKAVWNRLQQKERHLRQFGANQAAPTIAKPLCDALEAARATARKIEARWTVLTRPASPANRPRAVVGATRQPVILAASPTPAASPDRTTLTPDQQTAYANQRLDELYRLCQCAALVLTVNDKLATVASHIGGFLDLLTYLNLVTPAERHCDELISQLAQRARADCTATTAEAVKPIWENAETLWLTFPTSWGNRYGHLPLKLTRAGADFVRAAILPDCTELTIEKLEAARKERKAVKKELTAEWQGRPTT